MKRIYTIVGRRGTVMLTDSVTKKALHRQYDSTSLGELYTLKDLLTKIGYEPNTKHEEIAIVLPNSICGIAAPHTVNHWLIKRQSKRGTKLTMEFVGLVSDIVSLMNSIENLKLYGQYTAPGDCLNQYRGAWKCLEKVEPKVVKYSEAGSF